LGTFARRYYLLASLLMLGGVLVTGAAAQPAPCHFLRSPELNSWPAGFTGPVGASQSGNIDIISLDLSSDDKQLTVRIGLKNLNQRDPAGAVGVQYDVRADIATKRIHLDADVQAVGNEFFGFVESLGESSGQPEQVQLPGSPANLTGRVDPSTSTITITAPLSAIGLNYPLQVGRERALKNWYVSSARMGGIRATGGANFPGDHASTRRLYTIGEQPCGRIPPS
jgi:hypothetical protein